MIFPRQVTNNDNVENYLENSIDEHVVLVHFVPHRLSIVGRSICNMISGKQPFLPEQWEIL